MSAVDKLRCRVCASLQDAGASGHCARCFGPLEPVYDWERLARTITHASIEAGPRSLWRYEALLPVAAPTDAGGGPDAARLRAEARRSRRRGRGAVEARPHEPDALVQGPRRRRRGREVARARPGHA